MVSIPENAVALSCIDQIAIGRQRILHLPRSSHEACNMISVTLFGPRVGRAHTTPPVKRR